MGNKINKYCETKIQDVMKFRNLLFFRNMRGFFVLGTSLTAGRFLLIASLGAILWPRGTEAREAIVFFLITLFFNGPPGRREFLNLFFAGIIRHARDDFFADGIFLVVIFLEAGAVWRA